MQRLQRLLGRTALFLSVLLFALALVGCSPARPIKPSAQDVRVVALCDGYEICYDELRYVVMTYKDLYASRYGADVWTDEDKRQTYLPMLWEDVSESLKANYAILAMSAAFGIDINSKDIQDEVQSAVAAQIEALGGRRQYVQLLQLSYMTDRFVRLTVGADLCESQLAYAMVTGGLMIESQTSFLPYALDNENMCATYHVFIGNDVGDDVEDNRLAAERVRSMLLDGTPITDLIGSAYNEDIYAPSTPYYFMKTEYEPAYEEAAFALEIGGISEVVESQDGFYVIVRQPLSEAYILANVTELFQRYQYAQVENLLAEYRKTITVEWNDYGRELDLSLMQ